MLTFPTLIGCNPREAEAPAIARIENPPRYVIIGTAYGFKYTTNGDIHKWRSRSGAQKALAKYRAR